MNLIQQGSPRHEQTVAVALKIIIAQYPVQPASGARTQVIDGNAHPCVGVGGPGRSRTADQRFRKPLLYPTELRGHLD